MFDGWQLVQHLEEFVDLFLVFYHHNSRVRMAENGLDLTGTGVLEQADRRCTGGLRRQLGDVPLRPIVANDRHLIAGQEAQPAQAKRKVFDAIQVVRPGDLLPDAAILLAQGNGVR
jgi:hypothetical protein